MLSMSSLYPYKCTQWHLYLTAGAVSSSCRINRIAWGTYKNTPVWFHQRPSEPGSEVRTQVLHKSKTPRSSLVQSRWEPQPHGFLLITFRCFSEHLPKWLGQKSNTLEIHLFLFLMPLSGPCGDRGLASPESVSLHVHPCPTTSVNAEYPVHLGFQKEPWAVPLMNYSSFPHQSYPQDGGCRTDSKSKNVGKFIYFSKTFLICNVLSKNVLADQALLYLATALKRNTLYTL